jgi:hypothetical protein
MGDADDYVYYNPTAGLAVGGGEEESPEEMSEAASAVYEMLLSSDPSIIDNLMAMVELLARREPLAVAPPPPPTLPSPPVPPPTPPPPPPPPSFLVTHLGDPIFVADLCGIDRPMPLQALVSLVLVSKACRMALQGILEDRWVEALSSIVGYGEDPVGTHQPVDDFPVSAFTTVNNLPNARGILDLLLPHSRLSMRDDIIRRWGVHNLLQGHAPSLPLVDVRIQAKNTLDGLVNAAKGSSKRLNLLVQGSTVIQLLENGLRPEYLYMTASSGIWDVLGVTYNKALSAPIVRANMPDSTRLGGFVVQARLIAGATMDRKGVLGRPCAHSRFCVRTDSHYSKTCIQGRDLMIGGTPVGFIGFAAIGHLSGQKDYAIHHGHLCSTSALAIRRLLLGSFQMEEIKVYI